MFDPNQFGAMLGSMQDSIKELAAMEAVKW